MKFYVVRFLNEVTGQSHWFKASIYHCQADGLDDASQYSSIRQARATKKTLKEHNFKDPQIWKITSELVERSERIK